jgi:hypothetical protein
MNPRDTRYLITNYKQLGCAVIEQAIKDYWDGLESEEHLRKFLYETTWVMCLDLDIDNLFTLAVRKKARLEHAKKEGKNKK